MKGIKGERKYYGKVSPQHRMFTGHNVPYAGTRVMRDHGNGPWYIYQTEKGKPADHEAIVADLLAAGYTLYCGLDNDEPQPTVGSAYGKGKTYTSYNLRKSTLGGKRLETVHVITYNNAGKPAKDETHINQIVYLG